MTKIGQFRPVRALRLTLYQIFQNKNKRHNN